MPVPRKANRPPCWANDNMDFGHGGASGRFDYLKDIALMDAFLFNLEGITH